MVFAESPTRLSPSRTVAEPSRTRERAAAASDAPDLTLSKPLLVLALVLARLPKAVRRVSVPTERAANVPTPAAMVPEFDLKTS